MYTSPSITSTLSLHDALPISCKVAVHGEPGQGRRYSSAKRAVPVRRVQGTRQFHPSGARFHGWTHCGSKRCTPSVGTEGDRKSTRLNSSHVSISYAVFCLKKK